MNGIILSDWLDRHDRCDLVLLRLEISRRTSQAVPYQRALDPVPPIYRTGCPPNRAAYPTLHANTSDKTDRDVSL